MGVDITEEMDQPQKSGRQMRTKKEKEQGIKLSDINPATGRPYSEGGLTGGSGNYDLGRLMAQLLAQSQRPQDSASDYLRTKHEMRVGPEQVEREQYMADTYAAPFSGKPGALFTGRGASQLAPEAVLASQGNNAMNQWAQRGAMPGIDQTKLAGYNQQAATAGIPRLDPKKLVGGIQAPSSKGQSISQQEMDEFNRLASINTPKTYI